VRAFAYVIFPMFERPLGIVSAIVPGEDGPAAPLMHEDFPGHDFLDAVGHDGQQFYAIAREPMHLDDAAEALDRPRYRAQRMLYPMLAWALHPSGGGAGLVTAIVAVGLLGLFAGGVAFGALASTLGGRAELALLFPVLPGSLVSLGLSVPDALGLGLVFAALTLDLRGRPRSAIGAGVAAVLAKESLFLVLVGYALWRRDRRGALFAAVPALVAGTWWAALHLFIESKDVRQVIEFQPGRGLWFTLGYFARGEDMEMALFFGLAVVLAVLTLRRGALRGPLGIAMLLQLGFLAMLAPPVIAIWANGERTTLPLLCMAILAATVRARAAADDADDENVDIERRIDVRRPLAIPASAR
jgi:hypothetical protein